MTLIADTLARVHCAPAITRKNLSMIPLVARDPSGAVDVAVDYVPLGAAIQAGTAAVTEISEAGSVPTLAVRNDGERPLLIIDGEELIGARQNRVVNLSILAPPKRTLPIPVSCVERGRWSYRSRASNGFEASPRAMASDARARKVTSVSRSLQSRNERAADQGEVWRDVDRYMALLDVASPTAAMSDVYDRHEPAIEEYIEPFAPVDGQVGAVFAIDGVPVGVELFDAPETLRTYLPKIARSYALDALRAAPAVATASEPSALLAAVAAATPTEFDAIGLGRDVRLESPAVAGAALVLDGHVVHLCAFRRDGASTLATAPHDL